MKGPQYDTHVGFVLYLLLQDPGEQNATNAALPGALVKLAITVHGELQAAGDENAPVALECLARIAAAQAALSSQQQGDDQLQQQQLLLKVERLRVSVDETDDMQEQLQRR